VIDVGSTTNGGRRSYRINAATIAAVASVLGIVVYLGGFISGYMLMRQNLTDLQASNIEIKAELAIVVARLTHVEDDSHYAAQGIADLKALTAGTKR
jgi:cell division protein FtsX